MFLDNPHTTMICTIRHHPEGGWAPVLHVTGTPAPEPHPEAISLPDVLSAIQYARNHYGSLPLAIDDTDATTRPA